MLRCRFIACADTALRDVETQQVSLIGILEEIMTPGFPVVLPRLAMYAMFDRDRDDPDNFACTLQLLIGGLTVGSCGFHLAFATALASRALIHVSDIMIPCSGILRAMVMHRSEAVAGVEIPVAVR